ncbi:MAG TPA: chromosome segregation protein SMC, partial [Woeseiaceae bacterium]|nr:chromosome segregation protein SMC [Woeseiaceae bacterium]
RSYSIIEQGMISRLIEAKPEEMRVFIEEAAGISKYKERRRETSNRIKHTKENLDRLLDLLEEVEKQIKHLDRQAKTAERYGRLRDEERQAEAELLALRLRALDTSARRAAATLADRETALQAAIADQRRLEADTERARALHGERNEAFNEVQGRYYKAGAEIARLEQAIEHAHELRERQQSDLEQAVQGAKEIAAHISQDRSEIEQLELSLNELVPGLEQAQTSEHRSRQSLERAEQALSEWQSRWDAFAAKSSDAQQVRNVEQTRIEQLESRLSGFRDRSRKLRQAEESANPADLQARFEQLAVQELHKRQSREEFERHLSEIADKIRKLREQDARLAMLVEERAALLQAAQSRYASLEAVQKAALGQGDESVTGWLAANGLQDNERVAQSLEVDNGWERAVETVLGEYLQAICVHDVSAAVATIGQIRSGSVTLLEQHGNAAMPGVHDAPTLDARVSGAPRAIAQILSHVYTADSLDAALGMRDTLAEDESVITIDGVWLSPHWLRVSRDKDARAGVLARE